MTRGHACSAPKRGVTLILEPGRYVWCGCGESDDVWCHRERCRAAHKAVALQIEEACRVKLCDCKQSGHPPRCDGTHHQL
jgi:CDGSH-type Zn-finger protein